MYKTYLTNINVYNFETLNGFKLFVHKNYV